MAENGGDLVRVLGVPAGVGQQLVPQREASRAAHRLAQVLGTPPLDPRVRRKLPFLKVSKEVVAWRRGLSTRCKRAWHKTITAIACVVYISRPTNTTHTIDTKRIYVLPGDETLPVPSGCLTVVRPEYWLGWAQEDDLCNEDWPYFSDTVLAAIPYYVITTLLHSETTMYHFGNVKLNNIRRGTIFNNMQLFLLASEHPRRAPVGHEYRNAAVTYMSLRRNRLPPDLARRIVDIVLAAEEGWVKKIGLPQPESNQHLPRDRGAFFR